MAVDFEHEIAANEYGFYCVPTSYRGRGVPDILARGEVYEPATLRFLIRHLGEGDIITGGSFIGDFFPALHRALAPKAQIHSFEPVPLSFAAAQETIRFNGLKQIKFTNTAVGETEDSLTMLIKRPNGQPISAGERIVEDQEADGDRHIEVPVKPLDSLIPKSRKVSVLHLDVEGFETPALKGATRILTKNKPMVLLECGKPWRERSYCDLLNSLAPDAKYQIMGRMERNAVFMPEG